ncbi:type IV pilus modification PilV family protein [Burkholderia sp. MR1-5-21]
MVYGTSLIEAMIAVALLAFMMLTVAGSQLAMARAQRTTIWRERALWLADARIERMRMVPDADASLAALAAAMLPDGAMAIEGGVGGVRRMTLGWRDGDAKAPARCGAEERSMRPPSCVQIPFSEVTANDR